jgi:hypothetical protein
MGLAVKLRDKPKLTEPTHADLDCHALGVSVQLPDTAAGGLFTCSTVPRPQLRGSPAGLHRAPQDVGRADPLAPARPYADEYALADFLRVSPWSGEALRTAVLRALLQTVTAIQAKTGWRLLFLSVDDSLCCKDIATRKLEAVSLHFDHVRQRRQQHQRFALCGRASATRPAAIPVDLAAVSQTQAGQSAQSAAPRAGLAAVDVSRAAQPGAADARRDRAAAAGQVQSLRPVRCLVCQFRVAPVHSCPRLALYLRRQSQSPVGHLFACRVVAPPGPSAHRAGDPPLNQRQPHLLHALSRRPAAPLSRVVDSGLLQTESPRHASGLLLVLGHHPERPLHSEVLPLAAGKPKWTTSFSKRAWAWPTIACSPTTPSCAGMPWCSLPTPSCNSSGCSRCATTPRRLCRRWATSWPTINVGMVAR